MKTTITTTIALLALAGVASADAHKEAKKKEEAPPAMAKPTPAKELDALKGWIKNWTCTGTNGAGEKATAKLAFKRELDNFWASIKFEVAKTAKVPAFTGWAFFGIDAVSKGWELHGWDNFGGAIHMKAKEATATAVTWDGDAVDMGKKAPAKFTLTIDDKKKLKFIGEFSGKKAFEYDCK